MEKSAGRIDLGEELEQDGRIGGGSGARSLGAPDPGVGGLGGAHLLAVPPHVTAQRLPHLEAEPADVALVLLLLLRRRLVVSSSAAGFGGGGLLLVLLERPGADAELEAVAAPQVAGPVAAERLERGEGAAAGLADELPLPRRGHHGAPPPRPLRPRRRRGPRGVGRRGRVRAQRQRQRHLARRLLLRPRVLHDLRASRRLAGVGDDLSVSLWSCVRLGRKKMR